MNKDTMDKKDLKNQLISCEIQLDDAHEAFQKKSEDSEKIEEIEKEYEAFVKKCVELQKSIGEAIKALQEDRDTGEYEKLRKEL